jgi:DsbC/DsbD-like thiol-disulfide interchange protein
MRRLLVLLIILCVPVAVAAEYTVPDYSKVASVQAYADVGQAAPGKSFQIGLFVSLQPGWHIYWKHPGDTGLPTRITAGEVPGLTFGELRWPIPHIFEQAGGMKGNGYEKSAAFLLPVTVAPDAEEKKFTIPLQLSWLLCSSSVCVPGGKKLSVEVSVADAVVPFDYEEVNFKEAEKHLVVPYSSESTLVTSITSSDTAKGREYRITWSTTPQEGEVFYVSKEKLSTRSTHELNGNVSIFTPGTTSSGRTAGELVIAGKFNGEKKAISFQLGDQ